MWTADTMSTMMTRCVLTLLVISPAALAGQMPRWQVDSASVTFEIRNAGFPVRGSFGGLEAELCFDPQRPDAGRFAASIDPATIQTGIGLRDRHLQRREYFYVEKYGAVALRSTRLWRADTGYAGTFLLRIRDVEREVNIAFDFEPAGSRARLSGSLALDRLDYGIGEQSLILGDEVIVRVALALARHRTPVAKGGCQKSPIPPRP